MTRLQSVHQTVLTAVWQFAKCLAVFCDLRASGFGVFGDLFGTFDFGQELQISGSNWIQLWFLWSFQWYDCIPAIRTNDKFTRKWTFVGALVSYLCILNQSIIQEHRLENFNNIVWSCRTMYSFSPHQTGLLHQVESMHPRCLWCNSSGDGSMVKCG